MFASSKGRGSSRLIQLQQTWLVKGISKITMKSVLKNLIRICDLTTELQRLTETAKQVVIFSCNTTYVNFEGKSLYCLGN